MQSSDKITIEYDVSAPMRDGTILRANIYRPAGEGKWPVLLVRTPYDKNFTGAGTLSIKKGHRIRLDITSSNFPCWDRNPNTGHDFGADDEPVVAHQAILHDAEHPSYIVLPLVPVQ